MSPTLRTVEKTLAAENLDKSYRGRRVVQEVNLEINEGEVVGLLGPNGAGKTTTFYMIVGLTPPNGGRVLLGGEDMGSAPSRKPAGDPRSGCGSMGPSCARGSRSCTPRPGAASAPALSYCWMLPGLAVLRQRGSRRRKTGPCA